MKTEKIIKLIYDNLAIFSNYSENFQRAILEIVLCVEEQDLKPEKYDAKFIKKIGVISHNIQKEFNAQDLIFENHTENDLKVYLSKFIFEEKK